MNKDYGSFLKEDRNHPPTEVSDSILNTIVSELNPTHTSVFIKLFIVQVFVGLLSLLFCPQYSLSLTSNHQVFHYFHHNFGAFICMIICGTIFMGPSMLFAGLVMNRSDLRLVLNTNGLYFISLILISFGTFFLAGADIFITTSFFWIIGALCSSYVGIFTGRFLRIRVEQI